MVKLPSKEDLLGDKLTAFAPHTKLPTKLNKLKKSNIEAFFFLYEIQKLQLR